MTQKINGISVLALTSGMAFAYSGVKGTSILMTFQGLIRGKSPSAQPVVSPIGDVSPAAPALGTLPGLSRYSQMQLVQLWQQAGGSPGSATNAACHGMQESSGNPSATSPNPDGGTNVGLWQLDTKGAGSGHTVDELKNPLLNAQITVRVTRDGADWSQWATPGC